MRLALLALLLALPLAARAADAPGPEVVGFSADGRYVAYVEHGTGEGSGFPWAKLTVLDVAKHAAALPPTRVSLESGKDTDTEEAAVAMARKALGMAEQKLHVQKWVPADKVQTGEKGMVRDTDGSPVGWVQVKTHPASKKQGAKLCDAPFQPLLVDVVVSFMDEDKPARLGSEKAFPQNRPCLTSCDLGDVYAHGKAALVFARCTGEGFEGPATLDVPIAGTLPYPLIPAPIPEQPEANPQ